MIKTIIIYIVSWKCLVVNSSIHNCYNWSSLITFYNIRNHNSSPCKHHPNETHIKNCQLQSSFLITSLRGGNNNGEISNDVKNDDESSLETDFSKESSSLLMTTTTTDAEAETDHYSDTTTMSNNNNKDTTTKIDDRQSEEEYKDDDGERGFFFFDAMKTMKDLRHKASKDWRRGMSSKSLGDRIEEMKLKQSELKKRFRMDLHSMDNTIDKLKTSLRKTSELGIRSSSRFKNAIGTIVVAIGTKFCEPEKKPMTLLAIVFCSMLGSSLGFCSFLYFISVGYAAAIGSISTAALMTFNIISNHVIPPLTNLHTAFTLLWALRLILFLIHREYVNWPQWHDKILEVNDRAKMQSKFSVWMSCTIFYAAMAMPCIYRLQAAVVDDKSSPGEAAAAASWGTFGCFGIALQGIGLAMESVADYQKGTFKAMPGRRNEWCDVGLWRVFTHPNYFGEILFWTGTYIGGMAAYDTVVRWLISSIGLLGIILVMKQATEHLDEKQMVSYRRNEEFVKFRSQHGFFGPKITYSKNPIKYVKESYH